MFESIPQVIGSIVARTFAPLASAHDVSNLLDSRRGSSKAACLNVEGGASITFYVEARNEPDADRGRRYIGRTTDGQPVEVTYPKILKPNDRPTIKVG